MKNLEFVETISRVCLKQSKNFPETNEQIQNISRVLDLELGLEIWIRKSRSPKCDVYLIILGGYSDKKSGKKRKGLTLSRGFEGKHIQSCFNLLHSH